MNLVPKLCLGTALRGSSASRLKAELRLFCSQAELGSDKIGVARATRDTLGLDVGLDVPAHFAGGRAFALGVLFLVLDLELGEVERHVFAEVIAGAMSRG